jgi:hypothetical protein
MDNYIDCVIEHYNNVWVNNPEIHLWNKGPLEKLNYDFRVLIYPPSPNRDMWTYATGGMSSDSLDNEPIELHIFSHRRDDTIIELLYSLAYYHKNTSKLNLNHTVNFGRSWQDNSKCTYGFISLPYLDGPELEDLYLNNADTLVKFYWVIPILESEANYKSNFGAEALEGKFDQNELDYLNPARSSIL